MRQPLLALAAVVLCAPYDEHHGSSGTFIVGGDGKRAPATPDKDGMVRVGDQELHRPETRPHKDGDAPRDAKGERVDRGLDQQAQAAPQPALPEPAATPPWAPTPAEAQGEAQSAAGERTARRATRTSE